MKTKITLEDDETVRIHTEAKEAEDIAAEFGVIFGGMVCCINHSFGKARAVALIEMCYYIGSELLKTLNGDGDNKIAEYKETKQCSNTNKRG